LALLSLALLLWQWLVARRFPLHQRVTDASFTPDVTLLKPLKGCDAATEDCLRSWFAQQYGGRVQILFGVASAEDPVCTIVQRLQKEFPDRDAQLLVSGPLTGTNAKVSKLAQLEPMAKHDLFVISDADVRVPPDFLANVVAPFALHASTLDTSSRRPCALVNCFYRLANPTTAAMQWEAIAINADFWSQVLQSRSLKPLDFALGAVMAVRQKQLQEIGGFDALKDCLADDYQLGNRIAKRGYRLELSPVVVECWSAPMGWAAVWKHQLRWARTIRVCQPVPYFFSILSNAAVWPLLWLFIYPANWAFGVTVALLLWRVLSAQILQNRLTRTPPHPVDASLVVLKDLLGGAIWVAAFMGNEIGWRGEMYHIQPGGKMIKKILSVIPNRHEACSDVTLGDLVTVQDIPKFAPQCHRPIFPDVIDQQTCLVLVRKFLVVDKIRVEKEYRRDPFF
jgi:ceramide glucosyltransferase